MVQIVLLNATFFRKRLSIAPYFGKICAAILCIFSVITSFAAEEVAIEKFTTKPAFIDRLKSVSDSGKLYELDRLTQLLQVSFSVKSDILVPEPSECGEKMGMQERQNVIASATSESWYRSSKVGVKDMSIPGFAINPPSRLTDAPQINFEFLQLTYCNDPNVTLRTTRRANLRFSNLPAFLCISASDINTLLPTAVYHQATDGVSFYWYKGNVNERNATSLEFMFRVGAGCAISADIAQDDRQGTRYQQASSTQRTCRVALEATELKEFCSKRAKSECPPVSWNAWGDYVANKCKTIQELYDGLEATEDVIH
jgi:hypothetical protein